MTKPHAKGELSLFDVVDISEEVPFRDGFLRVRTISAKQIVALIQRFPVMANMLSGRGGSPEAITDIGPDCAAAVIAASLTGEMTEKAEAAAIRLPLDIQLKILNAVWRLTFTEGFGPFVEMVTTVLGAVAKEIESQGARTKASATKSPPSPSPSLPPGILPT